MCSIVGKGADNSDSLLDETEKPFAASSKDRPHSRRRAIAAQLTRSECCRQLAQLFRLRGRLQEAIDTAKEAVQVAPDESSSRNLLVNLLLEQGDYENVIKEGEAWLKREPDSIGALEALAQGYWQKADLKSAIRVFSRLLYLNPHETQTRFQRGMLYQYVGCWASALEDFQQVERMTNDEQMRRNALQAVEHLDKIQLRQITLLLFDCPVFREEFQRDREQAITVRGFALSKDGWSVIQWMQTDWANVEVVPDQAYVPFD